jgi:hypothetical protein
MKSIKILLFILFAATFACNEKTQSDSSTEEITDIEVVENIIVVDDLLENPDAYVGKIVEIEGLVTHVCKHSGKRLHLTSTASNKMIRVEAAEGITQFNRELEGSDLVIAGMVQKQVIDENYLAKWETEISGKGENHDHSNDEEQSEQLKSMRKRLEESGKSELVSYWVDGNSFIVK